MNTHKIVNGNSLAVQKYSFFFKFFLATYRYRLVRAEEEHPLDTMPSPLQRP